MGCIDFAAIEKMTFSDAMNALIAHSDSIKVKQAREKKFNPSGRGPYFDYAVTGQEIAEQIARHKMPYYVYVICSKSGAAFYVGKGAGDRVLDHAKEVNRKKPRDDIETAKQKAIRLCGDGIRYAIVAVCSDERMALAVEAS